MRVLVTGGAGFVGVNLAQHLVEHGHELTSFDNYTSGHVADAEAAGYSSMIEGDIRDREALAAAAHGIDAIVHLAAQAGVPSSIADPVHDAELNVYGTLHALMAARENKVNRFVFASSAAPLGGAHPAAESSPIRPLSPYGASKAAGESYCGAFAASYDMNATALRFSNLYGPYSYHKGSVIAHYMKAALEGDALQINGDGSQTRDFLYISDLVAAIRLVLEADKPAPLYQLGTGDETSILDVVAEFEDLFGEIGRFHAPQLPGEVPRSVSDISLARKDLGFDPRVQLKDGLVATKQWFEQTKGLASA